MVEEKSSVQGPPNHVEKIGNLRVRRRRTPPAWFLRRGRRVLLSNQRDFVGLGQDSDARFLLNKDVSDFALRDFPLTFQDAFLVLTFFSHKSNEYNG